jgi:hypothetical protein
LLLSLYDDAKDLSRGKPKLFSRLPEIKESACELRSLRCTPPRIQTPLADRAITDCLNYNSPKVVVKAFFTPRIRRQKK